MAAPGQGRCGYCDEQNVPLRRLNSTELLDMMLAHDARYTRRTVFCNVCTEKILAKYRRQKTRRRLKERKAQSSIDDPTTSYSNASLNPSLSQSLSPQHNRSGAGGASTSRQADDNSDSPMEIVLPPDESTDERQRSSTSSATRRSNRSNTSNVDYGNNDYDYDDDGNQTGDNGSVSSQAPMPSDPHQRTQSLSSNAAELSSSRMSSMTSAERSDTMRNYNRGSGG